MSLDALIARMSATERARIAADLANLDCAFSEYWDAKTETFGSLRIEKRTSKFLELVVDELRMPG